MENKSKEVQKTLIGAQSQHEIPSEEGEFWRFIDTGCWSDFLICCAQLD